MAEPDRIACCIVGCGRSMRRVGAHTETMCSKHYRADARLLRLYKEATALFRKLYRWRVTKNVRWLIATKGRSFKITTVQKAHDRALRRWDAIKANSQRLQDQGCFERRPRKSVKSRQNLTDKRQNPRVADAFEREFQRAKSAMGAQHGKP